MGPPCSDKISRVPSYSRTILLSTHTGLSPTLVWLSRHFCFLQHCHWASPLSLATTQGISVDFFSYGYLDVSVLRVRLPCGIINKLIGFPHSDISGSQVVCHLSEAFRRLQRPSSPPAAKASTVCAYSLDHITLNQLLFHLSAPSQFTQDHMSLSPSVSMHICVFKSLDKKSSHKNLNLLFLHS